MIVISDKNEGVLTYFPKNFNENYEKYEVEISNSGGVINRFPVYEEITYYSYYYTFLINFEQYPDGEYKLKLFGDDKIISYQLIQIGEYKLDKSSYTTKKPIKEYYS